VEATGEESFWAFRRLVETLTREHPLLLVFEDVHWAEPTLLELIEHVAERAADAPVLVVCTARPELLEKRPGWAGGKTNAATLLLRPLRDEDAHALLDELVVSLPDEVRDRVIATSEGNPLFVEQLAAMLADAPPGPGPLPVPPTIQAVLAARLDRLGPGERSVLEAAAVIGREFNAAPVAQLVPGEARASTPRNLDALVRKGLVRLMSGSFRFAHVLVQDATYRAIPKERRAQLHEAFIGWLEQEPEERMAEQQEVVGYHLEQAFRYRTEVGIRDDHSSALARRATELLGAAGRRAVAREDFPAAENLLSRATALVEPDDWTRIELLPSLGRTLVMSGSFERGKMILDEACERLATSGLQATHAHALAERGNLLFWRGGMLEESRREAVRALEMFTALGDEPGLANAWQLVARMRRFQGVSDHRDALERALEYAQRAADSAREGDAVHHICWALIDGPAPFEEILRYAEWFWDWATGTGDPSRASNAAGPLTYIRAMQGRFDEARELHEWNTQNVAIRGHRIGLFSSAILAGRVEMLAQAPAAAESAFLSAYQQCLDTGLRLYLPWTAVRLARALLAQERPAEAMRFLDTAEADVSDDSVPFQLMLHGTRARALAQEGNVEAAISVAGEGIRQAGQTDYFLRLAQAQLDLGDVLFAAEERAEARTHTEEALRLFEHKGDVSSAALARRLICSSS
jgi:tetratricopeptide (TPR) repeat protein